jgi:hypothetical protein
MRRPGLVFLIAVCLLAGMGAGLRHDWAQLCRRQGDQRLRSGDYSGALEVLRRAERVEPGSRPTAFAAGVALYRLRNFPQARERFALASLSAEPALRAAALYNLGNCLWRQAEQRGGSDTQAARQLLGEAAGNYRKALVAAPNAEDARHNLALVQVRLAGLDGATGRAPGSGKDRPGSRGAEQGAGGKTALSESAGRGGEPTAAGARSGQEGGQGRDQGKGRSQGDRSDAPAHSGKAQPTLTRDAAERMLNDARGRETRSAAVPTQAGRGRQARPARDW